MTSVVSVVGILKDDGARHRVPCLAFGVWCAHPGPGGLWRVSHGPTGKALFCGAADCDWWTAIRIAEEFHRVFGEEMPCSGVKARNVIVAVTKLSEDFIESTDWMS